MLKSNVFPSDLNMTCNLTIFYKIIWHLTGKKTPHRRPLLTTDCVRVLHVFPFVVSSPYRVRYVNIFLYSLLLFRKTVVFVHGTRLACKNSVFYSLLSTC